MKKEYKNYYEKFGLNVVYYRSHISAIELGNVGVSFDVIFKMCEVLEITPKQLFDFRD